MCKSKFWMWHTTLFLKTFVSNSRNISLNVKKSEPAYKQPYTYTAMVAWSYIQRYLVSENITSDGTPKLNQEEKAKNHCKLKEKLEHIIRKHVTD